MSTPFYYSQITNTNIIDVKKQQEHFFVDTYYAKYKDGEYKLWLDKDLFCELKQCDAMEEIKKYIITEVEDYLSGYTRNLPKNLKKIK